MTQTSPDRHENRQPRAHRALVMILLSQIVLGAIFINPGWIKPDSVGTYAYLRSMVIDRDLSFLNEWSGFELIRDDFTLFKETLEDGRVANHWWVGTSILSAPMYVAAHLSRRLTGLSLDGVSGAYTILLAWSSIAFTIGSLFLAWLSIRQSNVSMSAADHERKVVADAAISVAAILLGTPLFFYTYRMSLGTHAAGTLLVGGLTWLLLSESDERREFLTGLIFGLAVATRLQHFTLSGGIAVAGWQKRWNVRSWLLFATGAALGWSPQAAAWLTIYDTPLGPLARGSNLTGTTWSPFRDNAMLDVLFSGWHGLFIWSPIVLLSIAGWVLFLERPASRILLMMFAGQWLANGLLDRYFWGGLSFGARRFVDLAVPFAIGVAWFIEWAARRQKRGLALTVVAVTSAWSIGLVILTFANRLELSRSTTVGDLLGSFRNLPRALENIGLAISRDPALHLSGILCTIFFVAAVYAFASRKPGFLTIALTAVMLLTSAAFIAVRNRTIEHARIDSQRFRINPARRAIGPLIDQRALLGDLAEHQERSGDQRAGDETREEIASVEKTIGRMAEGAARRN